MTSNRIKMDMVVLYIPSSKLIMFHMMRGGGASGGDRFCTPSGYLLYNTSIRGAAEPLNLVTFPEI